MCGEQEHPQIQSLPQWGSPPRVRGTDEIPRFSLICRRITPACAGNRPSYGQGGGEAEDHPRVCGEQVLAPGASLKVTGSPPRVRGTAFWTR